MPVSLRNSHGRADMATGTRRRGRLSGRFSRGLGMLCAAGALAVSVGGALTGCSTRPTTLKVISAPDGAAVEDVAPDGFGYLGRTPLVREFRDNDLKRWADVREKGSVDVTEHRSAYVAGNGRAKSDKVVQKRTNRFDALALTLRISKPGFEDSFIDDVRIPVGQRRVFQSNLREKSRVVSFASDPPGTHVYVKREDSREVYDPKSRKIDRVAVQYRKHLGTTPFTLNVDEADPLRHGETLVFEKPGFTSAETLYAGGFTDYFQVMTPVRPAAR